MKDIYSGGLGLRHFHLTEIYTTGAGSGIPDCILHQGMGCSNSVVGFAFVFSSQDLKNYHGCWSGLNKVTNFPDPLTKTLDTGQGL